MVATLFMLSLAALGLLGGCGRPVSNFHPSTLPAPRASRGRAAAADSLTLRLFSMAASMFGSGKVRVPQGGEAPGKIARVSVRSLTADPGTPASEIQWTGLKEAYTRFVHLRSGSKGICSVCFGPSPSSLASRSVATIFMKASLTGEPSTTTRHGNPAFILVAYASRLVGGRSARAR